jgi:hypothetical protein
MAVWSRVQRDREPAGIPAAFAYGMHGAGLSHRPYGATAVFHGGRPGRPRVVAGIARLLKDSPGTMAYLTFFVMIDHCFIFSYF